MYNGIGLPTPRGSGTNGYIVRNLSALRSHDPAGDRANAWDSAPPKHREPDASILEHERKRKVEVKCLELQLELEEKGYDGHLPAVHLDVIHFIDSIEKDEIEGKVNALREKLLKNLASFVPTAKNLKPTDTHGLAAAKKVELDKMARALGTRSNYQEGQAFDREKQEEDKIRRKAEREEREALQRQDREKMMAQRAKWEADKRERDRLRRREEDRIRRENQEMENRKDKLRDFRSIDRRGSPRGRRYPPRDHNSGPASPHQASSYPRSRSASPRPRMRRRFESRSPSRSTTGSRSPPRYRRSRSPPRTSYRDRTPPRRAGDSSPLRRGRSPSRSRSPPRREKTQNDTTTHKVRSMSPPVRGSRGRSISTGSSMSVSSRSDA